MGLQRSTEARREISVLNSRLSLLEKELDLHSSDGPGNSSLLGMTSPCSNMSFGSMGGNSSMILSPGGNHSMNQSLTGGGPAGSSSFRSHSSFCHSVGGPEARVPDLDFEFLVVDDLHQSSFAAQISSSLSSLRLFPCGVLLLLARLFHATALLPLFAWVVPRSVCVCACSHVSALVPRNGVNPCTCIACG